MRRRACGFSHSSFWVLSFLIRGSSFLFSCFRHEKPLQQHHVDSPSKTNLAIHRYHGHHFTVAHRKGRVAIHVDLLQHKPVAPPCPYQLRPGFFAQMASLPGVHHHLQTAEVRLPPPKPAKHATLPVDRAPKITTEG